MCEATMVEHFMFECFMLVFMFVLMIEVLAHSLPGDVRSSFVWQAWQGGCILHEGRALLGFVLFHA